MTTNFTLRDFFAFLLTGCVFTTTMVILFYNELLCLFEKYNYLSGFSWISLLLIIPSIYLIGHIFGSISFLMFRAYDRIPKSGCGDCLLSVIQSLLLYRQRVAYSIEKNKDFQDREDFWTKCAVLQIEKIYSPAEYWSYLNEFFNSINLVFIVSGIISICFGHCIIGFIYWGFAFVAFFRAKQYAGNFVLTVVRLAKAKDQISGKQ